MGFLNKLFGGDNQEKNIKEEKVPWIFLNDIEQLKEIKDKSFTKTQVIFKHSTTCGISRMVLNIFTSGFDIDESKMDFYYLDLLEYRAVSNEVASFFNTYHQSPQLLVIKNGVVVAHESHGAIDTIDLKKHE